jgi:hypothetical protein
VLIGEIVQKKIKKNLLNYVKFVLRKKFCFSSLFLSIDFIKILYETYEKEAETSGKERLLITAAVAAAKVNIDKGYEVDKLVP